MQYPHNWVSFFLRTHTSRLFETKQKQASAYPPGASAADLLLRRWRQEVTHIRRPRPAVSSGGSPCRSRGGAAPGAGRAGAGAPPGASASDRGACPVARCGRVPLPPRQASPRRPSESIRPRSCLLSSVPLLLLKGRPAAGWSRPGGLAHAHLGPAGPRLEERSPSLDGLTRPACSAGGPRG